MGQKVNPHGLRVGVIKDWDSRWFADDKTFGDTLVSDYKLRKYLKEKLYSAGVPKIEIERTPQNVKVLIHCAKPGVVIGRGGAEIEKLRLEIEKLVGKPALVNVAEVKSPDLDAQLVAESIAAQLEKRIAFRRAMKQAIGRTMRLGAKGIKISCGGRLNGAEIARTEHYHEAPAQMKMFLTRIGFGSKVIVTGDSSQKDLPVGAKSGLDVAARVLKNIDDIAFCNLTNKDVVRHPLVQKIVKAYDDYEARTKRR